MRVLNCASSAALALACLIGLGAILATQAASAAPRAGIVPVTTTIQAAVNAAQAGDTILIPAGIYTESLTIAQSITLTGVTSATTIIRAVSQQRVITVPSGHDLRVENLAIAQGAPVAAAAASTSTTAA